MSALYSQEKGGDGAKELEEMQSDRMKVVQLDVCSEDQVAQAAEFVRSNLEDPERGRHPHPLDGSLPHSL